MTHPIELWLLIGAGLVLFSVLVSPLATRLGAPILLIFLGIGMLVGQDGPGGLEFNDLHLAYDVGSIALAVILFAGGFGTGVEDIRVCWGPALTLATLGVVLTAAVVGAWCRLLGVPLMVALLLGSVVGSTDAAATFLLLQGRGIRLRGRVMETIVVESGLNDPMAIFLTVVFVAMVDSGGGSHTSDLLQTFLQQLGIGALGGILGGLVLGWLVSRLHLANGLFAVLALSGALALFGGVQLLGAAATSPSSLRCTADASAAWGAPRGLDVTHGSLAWLVRS